MSLRTPVFETGALPDYAMPAAECVYVCLFQSFVMDVNRHVTASLLLAIALYPFIGIFNSSLVFFSGFLFDVDHYLYYAIRYKKFSVMKCYRECKQICKGAMPRPKEPFLHPFHTIEFYLLLGIAAYYILFLRFVLLGLILHILLDIIDGLRKKTLHFRILSVFYYFKIRKRFQS